MTDKSLPYGQAIAQQQANHSARASLRHSINGQPNGYRPISEEELQREKQAEILRNARAA